MHLLCPFLSHNGITSAAHNKCWRLYAWKVLFHAIRKSVLKRAKRASEASSQIFAHQNRQKGKRLTRHIERQPESRLGDATHLRIHRRSHQHSVRDTLRVLQGEIDYDLTAHRVAQQDRWWQSHRLHPIG